MSWIINDKNIDLGYVTLPTLEIIFWYLLGLADIVKTKTLFWRQYKILQILFFQVNKSYGLTQTNNGNSPTVTMKNNFYVLKKYKKTLKTKNHY